jgi:hypothetical protein
VERFIETDRLKTKRKASRRQRGQQDRGRLVSLGSGPRPSRPARAFLSRPARLLPAPPSPGPHRPASHRHRQGAAGGGRAPAAPAECARTVGGQGPAGGGVRVPAAVGAGCAGPASQPGRSTPGRAGPGRAGLGGLAAHAGDALVVGALQLQVRLRPRAPTSTGRFCGGYRPACCGPGCCGPARCGPREMRAWRSTPPLHTHAPGVRGPHGERGPAPIEPGPTGPA